MKTKAGLWIDHRKAVVVLLTEQGEEVKELTSHMEKHVRFTGGDGSEEGSTEDVRDRQFGNHLNDFYDRVINVIRDADTIQIFGPGEAKGELKKRLDHDGYKGDILAVETMDKMTDRQISAKVQGRFPG
jgi:molybdopterin converting factor small subunit